jgi:hypothetical protein
MLAQDILGAGLPEPQVARIRHGPLLVDPSAIHGALQLTPTGKVVSSLRISSP